MKKFILVFSLMFLCVLATSVYGLLGCNDDEKEDNSENVFVETECDHIYNNWTNIIQPTCTSIGVNKRICSICGKEDFNFLESLGHDFVEEIECFKTDNGNLKFSTCSKCGITKTEFVKENELNFEIAQGGTIETIQDEFGNEIIDVNEIIFKTKVTVTIKADNGYEFEGWYINGELVSSSLTYTFEITEEIKEIKACFKKLPLKIEALDGGSIEAIKDEFGNYITDLNNISIGKNITVTANVKNGYLFNGWYINNSFVSSSLSYTFEMTDDIYEVKAYFELEKIRVADFTITLTWGETPSDLDSHLSYYENGEREKHVYYQNKQSSNDIEYLDRDDTDSYGPEVITISEIKNGYYRFSVHDYTNKNNSSSSYLSNSGARVVFKSDNTIREFTVPIDKTGNLWNVFDYNGETGELILINEIVSTTSDTSNIDYNFIR